MDLEPSEERVGVDSRYTWRYPLPPLADGRRGERLREVRSVWYLGLPLTSAHRGSHSGGGAPIAGGGDQTRYENEGTVYPHASLVEMITYHHHCFPDVEWRYLDVSHLGWAEIRDLIHRDPPDVAAFSVYSATAVWALIIAAEIKRVNSAAIVVFGNDHAGIMYREVLTGAYGGKVVDFVSTGNNGPFTMMGLLYALRGSLELREVPSLAYRNGNSVHNQPASTYPLTLRLLPDYRLIKAELEQWYDPAFAVWYAQHYELKRMITLPIDGGCHWGSRPSRRCKHCSIQGLTPKVSDVQSTVAALEVTVGDLNSNVYAAGDSTLGMSRNQWSGQIHFLDDLAEACEASSILRGKRFMLAYGLVQEFLQSAELCKGFVRTWNVGLEAFDPHLLKQDSKGINKGPDRVYEALELARALDYKLYISGILGLPGTTIEKLRSEVDQWLALAAEYQDNITTVSVAAPAVIPGSRMYWESYTGSAELRRQHREILPVRHLSQRYVETNSDVAFADVERAIQDVTQGIMSLDAGRGKLKVGGYMLGGNDEEETRELRLLDEVFKRL